MYASSARPRELPGACRSKAFVGPSAARPRYLKRTLTSASRRPGSAATMAPVFPARFMKGVGKERPACYLSRFPVAHGWSHVAPPKWPSFFSLGRPRLCLCFAGISVWQNSSDGACASCNGNTSPSDSVSSAPNSPSKGRPSSSGRGSAKDDCSPSHASNWFHYAKAKDFFGQKKLSSAWQKSNNFWEL